MVSIVIFDFNIEHYWEKRFGPKMFHNIPVYSSQYFETLPNCPERVKLILDLIVQHFYIKCIFTIRSLSLNNISTPGEKNREKEFSVFVEIDVVCMMEEDDGNLEHNERPTTTICFRNHNLHLILPSETDDITLCHSGLFIPNYVDTEPQLLLHIRQTHSV